MIRVVEDEIETKKIQKKFESIIGDKANKSGVIRIGYRGGSDRLKAYWFENQDIWFASKLIEGSRYWNAFGIGEPKWGSSYLHTITVEINIPQRGLDRRIAGTYVADEDHSLFITHNGRIGGGRKGIGKKIFTEEYRGKQEIVRDSRGEREVALVAGIESPNLIMQIGEFIEEINRIKNQ